MSGHQQQPGYNPAYGQQQTGARPPGPGAFQPQQPGVRPGGPMTAPRPAGYGPPGGAPNGYPGGPPPAAAGPKPPQPAGPGMGMPSGPPAGPAAPQPMGAPGMRPPGAAMPGAMPGAPRPAAAPVRPGFAPQQPGMPPQQQPGMPRPMGPPGPGGMQPPPARPSFAPAQPGGPRPAMGMRPAMPGLGAPPQPGMGMGPPQQPGMGMGPPQQPGMGMGMGMGYDQSSMQATLDAFETLSLGPSAPTMPGQAPDGGANPAAFPRPAGPTAEAHVGPPEPYSPVNCKPEFVRMTSCAVPNSQALKSRWHLPYGAVVHPMAQAGGVVPVANPTGGTIIRCKRCRTYINPFMSWMDGGRRYSCNVCQMVNEVPVEYFCSLDANGRRLDHDERPELCGGSVEYVAPAEYMVRAPMPPTYVFVIDVSFAAAACGMLGAACSTIKASLDSLPGDERTQVAFITFDNTLHFYNLKSSLSQPQMMVVAEVDDPFVPLPDDLLVNLRDSRALVDALLDSLPQSYGRASQVESAMGPALQAAFLVMNHIGGKLLLFQAAAPSVGIGRIKARDNPALYGTDREYSLRTPDDPFYKRFSAEASRFQICVDVFAFGSAYMDLPSLGALPKYTGGQLYYYPGFAAERDGPKLQAELSRNLARETAWEAVMRIRCSKGLRISAFFGHFFIRSTDLLALPACDVDKSFSVEIAHEETLVTGQVAYLQAALLYTNSCGERRIRVHTLALPVVSDLIDLYKQSDAGATAALMGKLSVERSYSAKLDDVRTSLQQRLVATLREYRMLHMRGAGPGMGTNLSPNSLVLPERLKGLPLLTLGLLKTAALRGGGRDVNSDERAAVGHQMVSCSVYDQLRLIYPSCYPVYELAGDWGKEKSTGEVVLPSTAPAGLEYFNPAGAYIVDNGRMLILWLGQAVPPSFYAQVFGVQGPPQDTAGLNPEPVRQGSELSARINAVMRQLRDRRELWQECWTIRQGTPMEAHLMPFLVEDRQATTGSMAYLDFMLQLQKLLMAK
ncbi:hypothetical protein CHLNCDRAFT_135519 [Chlorella variabilis]|uniref:Uncharacterized protein n=1 Tax=Chlorella variabilis TaxID=554065 RepID=E1ZIC7_CHLVA|nr:hypothetical protein CHLNCDRAFT_135519 [Chlorella variabilis]EFN54134.1 hypothetical protein CHLNCDRAFT_135519 [Chlorella variabilis]|eukprot:XP_005846236.1 hypothetical protein CHLNCDRAFT_135519 [Chlorella variabilis]